MTNPVKLLSDDDLREIEARTATATWQEGDGVNELLFADIPALCQTVRALRTGGLTMQDAYDKATGELKQENTALREQLAEARLQIKAQDKRIIGQRDELKSRVVLQEQAEREVSAYREALGGSNGLRRIENLKDQLAQVTQERDAAREMVTVITTEKHKVEQAAVTAVIPYEALLLDSESRRWIAPAVWEAMENGCSYTNRSQGATMSHPNTERDERVRQIRERQKRRSYTLFQAGRSPMSDDDYANTEYLLSLLDAGGPREMPPLQTLYAMFEEWRRSFPADKQPERGSPETEQLIDAWIAGFAKHNEITCAATSSPTPAENWSREFPKVDGVYWLRFADPESQACIVEVVRSVVFQTGVVGDIRNRVEIHECEWLGPLTPHAPQAVERRLKPPPYKRWCEEHQQAPPCTVCDWEDVATSAPAESTRVAGEQEK